MTTSRSALGRLLLAAAMGALSSVSLAQAPPASPSSPQAEAGEPRVSTPVFPDSSAAAEQGTAKRPAAPSAPTAKAAAGGGAAGRGAAERGPAERGRADRGPADRARADRVDLNAATVTGDREQPKVMYVVPWKKADIGDLSGRPMNSLLDEALAPVDRDEFKREVAYYDALKSDTSPHRAPGGAAQGEK